MVLAATGNSLDVVVEHNRLGLLQRGLDEKDIIWLTDPEGVVEVLQAEIKRMTSRPKKS